MVLATHSPFSVEPEMKNGPAKSGLKLLVFSVTPYQNKNRNRSGHPHKMFCFPSPDRPIFLGKVKKKKFRRKYFSLQAHDLVLLTPIVLNYHRHFVCVAFLDIW